MNKYFIAEAIINKYYVNAGSKIKAEAKIKTVKLKPKPYKTYKIYFTDLIKNGGISP